MPRILVVTPKFPYPTTGACEQDRMQGIKDFIRYGYQVEVIAKIHDHQNKDQILAIAKDLGFGLTLVDYKYSNLSQVQKLKHLFRRLINPLFIDGATYEYTDREIKKTLTEKLDSCQPDIVWFEYTYLWPLYKEVRKRGIKIVTRSINFEPQHFLEEDGYRFINYLKFIPKFFNELLSIKKSDLVFSISPKEKNIYKKISPNTKVFNLPIRVIPQLIGKNSDVKDKDCLDIFFMGSSYNVVHNRKAVEFIIKDIAPILQVQYSNMYKLHILGAKLPQNLKNILPANTTYEGYVSDLELFLANMDIALVPSLCGAGQQLKVFEPIVRGIPTITSSRAMVGYDFHKDEQILLANNSAEYISCLENCLDFSFRQKISRQAVVQAGNIFNQKLVDEIVEGELNKVLHEVSR
jgi:hypothetical protein